MNITTYNQKRLHDNVIEYYLPLHPLHTILSNVVFSLMWKSWFYIQIFYILYNFTYQETFVLFFKSNVTFWAIN